MVNTKLKLPKPTVNSLAPHATMMALVKSKPGVGNVGLEEVPEPDCTPDGVKIQVCYTGICGTDIHVYHDRFKSYPPVILGHEFTGIVTEVGAEVHGVHPGERVTVLPSSAVVCGVCEYCTRGYYMFCAIRRGMGHGVNGSFTKYVVVRQDQVYKLPESVSLEEGALAEPFASAVQAIEELTTFSVGDTVLLSGPGPIGLLCLLLLVGHKCKVIVAGTAEDTLRLRLARELGADVTVNVSEQDVVSVVERETGGKGVDVAVESAGAADSVIACMRCLKKMGKYVQVGIVGSDISTPFDLILYKQIKLFGSVGHSLMTWERVQRIFEQRKLELTRLITHKLPLSRWRDAFDICGSKQGVKVLLYYDGA